MVSPAITEYTKEAMQHDDSNILLPWFYLNHRLNTCFDARRYNLISFLGLIVKKLLVFFDE